MNAVATQQPYEVPEGGLASFLTATVGDWSDEALNSDNYYDIVKPTAEQLAAFGREEDDRIAHVATGETVIPMAVFEEDPALKEALFARMRDMGIEPERYIVGNELNSINPVTGQPEFFLKKIFKGIKKAVKGVVKVFKKIAPIVLSIGLSFIPGVGPILAGTLGSGIGTLIQGGSIKDAFKAALIGGAVAGIGSGISNVVKAQIPGGSAGGTFMEGIQGALPDLDKIQSTFTGATIPTTTGPEVAALDPNFGAGPAPAGYDPAGMLASTATDQAGVDAIIGKTATTATTGAGPLEDVLVTAQRITPQTPGVPEFFTPTVASAVDTIADERALRLPREDTSVTERAKRAYDKISDYAVRGGRTPGEIELQKALEGKQAYDNVIRQFTGSNPNKAIPDFVYERAFDAMEAAEAAAGPGFFAKYGPLTAAGLGIVGLAGGFEQPEMGELPDAFGGQTGMDLLTAYPGRYGLSAPGSQFQPVTYSANGGDISFPRRNGAIYGPGTETSDDIPAMLSDGEFVMTARAVRGAGNGSREAGMRRMYDMMRKFEGGAARGN